MQPFLSQYLGFFALIFSCFFSTLLCAQPVQLRCEYLENPLGLDAAQPRFTWRMEDDRRGARQTAYQLVVGTDSLAVMQGRGDVWDSGKQTTNQQLVRYAGKPLQPFTRYYWQVTIWDQDRTRKTPAGAARFEMGMMAQANWQGAWISDNQDPNLKPAPYFRKVFRVSKKIKQARAYIAAAGLFELSINGQPIGNHRLDPMYTRFDRRTLYVTHDVTAQLQRGDNAIGVLLGNGWYNHQSTAVWYFDKAPWRNRPTFCLDLRITYEDGSVETISSGKDWKTHLSPVIFNSIYTAEHYDARREQPGWNTAAFVDTAWHDVMLRSAPSPNIVAQALHPIRNVETVPTQRIERLNDTTYVFDLGRNISGVSQLRARGEAGTVLRLKHGERVYPNGHVDLSNIDVHYRPTDESDPFQTDIFILSGKGEETFMPRFNYKGFQYVEVTSNRPVRLTQESLTGYFMHSDVPPVGEISSSNPTLDQIWAATNHSYLANLFGYPTDCPQREKNGWTGDAHIASETGLYSFDGITIYEKWLADHRDEQQPNGVLPSIIPTDGWGYEWGNGPDWTSTIAIIPWNIYLFYGDTTLLAACYDNMRRYVDHITDLSPTGLTAWGLGDWVPVKSKSPVELTSSAYYFADATILAQAAHLLGHPDDARNYAALAAKIKAAYNAKYLDRETGLYGSGLQTELSVSLYWGLVPDELRAKVAANLAERVAADDYHLDVGLLGTKAILNALSENGYADVAYRVAAQETYPSWGWWIVNGATTLYENWDIQAANDISLNHIMFGEIGAWLYKGLGGIHPDPAQPGFKRVQLTPHVVPGLDAFTAAHDGPYGTIRSAWKQTGKRLLYTATVPPNATAHLTLPVGKDQKVYESGKPVQRGNLNIRLLSTSEGAHVYELMSGTYAFEIR
ncbi:alpha-L-rhamnosidase [Catalinimonas alkaloidigena]|uniref:alpha-L-rhamnosidase n=1 Tax=Catalinimonas alkaloidigena TaxID=1075417 RepID=A0A1G9IQ93_9BACT|nr:alpha-L-rhamnosidase [Catalinimonas alkaloidigena]SDL27327.1 alpha-L-rhamnosidase [Catalinimonas alkaloidigena]